MESLSSSFSPLMVLPPTKSFRQRRRRIAASSCRRNDRLTSLCSELSLPLSSEPSRRRPRETSCFSGIGGVGGAAEEDKEGEEEGSDDVETALHLDGCIPGTSDEFVKQVSSRAYDMRRHLQQTFDSSSYDVLEANPWREAPKPVYVLTHNENQLCTMKTRRNRSEVERELGLLFSKGRKLSRDPDLLYSDRFGRRNQEYISLGCDMLPVLKGRSPMQIYSDFMRSFKYTFMEFLGITITGIQVGMGPAGELKYPSYPSKKLELASDFPEISEFQCYDKYMLASLYACLRETGRLEWESGGPMDAGKVMSDPKLDEFFTINGSWDTPDGRFFLEWYSRMLLLHAERLCMAAETIFSGTGVNISAKLAGMHWPYCTQTRLSQLVAGYYKFSDGNGYFPIASIFGRYGLTLCCKYFGLVDREESRVNRSCSPEEYIGQLQLVARTCDIDLEGENIGEILDDEPFQKVLNLSKYDSDGLGKPSFSFNFVRMNGNLYEQNNWLRFVRFVRQMSDTGFFQAKLDSGGFVICQYSSLASLQVGSAFA